MTCFALIKFRSLAVTDFRRLLRDDDTVAIPCIALVTTMSPSSDSWLRQFAIKLHGLRNRLAVSTMRSDKHLPACVVIGCGFTVHPINKTNVIVGNLTPGNT